MNALKSICITAILTLSLAASVAAGEISTAGYTAPPPPPPPPDSNITITVALTEPVSNPDTVIAQDVANILWLLASIF